jgi:hypothetical protein
LPFALSPEPCAFFALHPFAAGAAYSSAPSTTRVGLLYLIVIMKFFVYKLRKVCQPDKPEEQKYFVCFAQSSIGNYLNTEPLNPCIMTHYPFNHSTSQPIIQSTSKPLIQSTNQPVNQ